MAGPVSPAPPGLPALPGSRGSPVGVMCELCLMVLLFAAITVGNAVTLWVLVRARQLRTPQTYLKASLALADLAVGLFVVPYSIFREAASLWHGASSKGDGHSLLCFITGPIFAGCTFVSISSIFLLSVERSMAVLRPLQRLVVITKRRTARLVLLSWALSFLLAIMPLFSGQDITLRYSPCSKMCIYSLPTSMTGPTSTIMLLFPAFDFSLLMITFAINVTTLAAIRRYSQARGQLWGRTTRGGCPSGADVAAARTIGLLTFAFLAAFIPIAVFVVGSVLGCQWCRFSFYAFWILVSNSCWNVAIYSAADPQFRRDVRELFCVPRSPRPRQQPSLACVTSIKEILHPGLV